MTQLSFLDDEPPPQTVMWTPERTAALGRLQNFIPRAGRAYAASRNYDFGPDKRNNISCLSPWIRHRLLREEDVLWATLARHSLPSAEKFVQEVFWRGYFKGWLEQHPDVWVAYRADVAHHVETLGTTPELRDRYETAIAGQTGIDCFDAWARELVETGYLHNHARMWFASIWIFTLRLPWSLGADFFYRHLLDGDPASNTLSWRWVAGLHTKGKNYLARPSNIEKYTDGRFSPQGLVPHADPLNEAAEYPIRPLAQITLPDEIPPYGLIVTQEDCHAESLPLTSNPEGILGLTTPEARSPSPTSDLVRAFGRGAVEGAVTRAQDHFDCTGLCDEAVEWGTALVGFANSLNVMTLVTAWLPVGPARAQMGQAMPMLEVAGIRVVQIMRPYDKACWPHANKGFFKLKKQIPALVGNL